MASTQMNIVYFYPSLHYSGGMERVLTTKMNYLADVLHYNVTIIAHRQFGRPGYFPLSPKVKLVEFNINEPGREFLNKASFWDKRKAINDFAKVYRKMTEDYLFKNKTDICISTIFGKEFNFLNKIKDGSVKIAEYHFSFIVSPIHNFKSLSASRSLSDIKNHFYQLKYINICNKYKKFVLLTHKDAGYWKKHLNNLKVIHNPITIKAEKPAGLTVKKAIAIGRANHQKGFEYLVEAWKIVHAKHPDWQLEIYGSGPSEELIKNKIGEYKLDEVVKIYKPRKDIENVYLNSSMYLMSSRFEGLPLVLMESMAFGLPAVSFDCDCGPSDLIDDGKSGFLVPVGDDKTMAGRICKLIEDEKLRNEFGKNARIKSQDFQIDHIMQQWVSLFQELKNNG